MRGKDVSVVMDQGPGGRIRAAYIEDGVVRSFYFVHSLAEPLLDDLFVGRVKEARRRALGWFVDLGEKVSGFLPSDKITGEAPSPGTYRLVQVDKEAGREKPVQLTEKIQLSGDHLVYLPNSNYVAISHQLDHEERECLRKEIAGWLRTPEGIIVRSKAGRKSAAVLIRELNQLRSEWRSLLKRSAAMKAPGRVCRRLSLLSSILNENHRPESCTVFSNIPVDNDEKISAGVDMIYEPADNLFAVHDLEKIWKSVEQPGVPLPKGASIAIEHTAALTAIDVNTGSRVVGDHWEEQALSINLDAAREIGRQLRLRGIGGMVAVDFLRLHKHENRDRVIDELERVTAQDPATVKIFGYSEMGLVELTRKRTRREAADRN